MFSLVQSKFNESINFVIPPKVGQITEFGVNLQQCSVIFSIRKMCVIYKLSKTDQIE